jgi:PhoH-like ATPase
LLGPAGTGKTLLALAAGLEQMIHSQQFHQIIVTRATVPLGEDIGYLPGTEGEKMEPWMGALSDNLDFLFGEAHAHAKEGGKTREKMERGDIMNRIAIKSMSFMRGRTLTNKFLIVDEAQNLTAKQMKALITRAGPGTKVVCLGNVAQIDTPYLTEGNCGITYAVECFKGWEHYGHITLSQVVRSRLAEHAAEAMQG